MWCLQKAYQFLCLVLFFLNFQANLSSSSSSSITQLCPHDQSFALLQLKATFSINNPAFPAKTISWKKGTDCCLWDGVNCDTQTGNVIGLDLNRSWLNGTIHSNSSLFLLHHLHKLNLASNPLRFSQISSEFGQFTNIRDLFLDEVDLSLIAPSSFLNLSRSITSLSLVRCGLEGKFPDGVLHFPHLQKLSLSDNEDLIVNFPRTNWSSSLRSLDLSSTTISGEIPESIGNLRSLEVLDLSKCHVKGPIPTSLGNLTKLIHLGLRSNSITGLLPYSISNLRQLLILDLSNNDLGGQIPDAFGNLTKLVTLHLAYNNFSGHLPSSIFELMNLTSLDLTSNKLSGIVESGKLSKLGKLETLNLSSTTLISFSSFNSDNYSLPNLRSLNLSSCNISGFPDFIRNLERLKKLDLSHNQIPVIDQGMFLRLENLTSLDLSYNSQLSLVTGNNVKNLLPNLRFLSFSSCSISEFPNFLRTLKKLEFLDLTNNKIQGRISKWESEGWSSLNRLYLSGNLLTDLDHYPGKNLQVLLLQSNKLEGPILEPPPSLRVFLVSGNKLTGEIPSFICNLSSLQILDLSDNNLSGTIPTCLGIFSNNLNVLDLQKNSFHGSIPDFFSKENKLESLNLNGNDFDGPLPQSFVNCSRLAVLNLGNNRLNDTFPYWLGSLPELQVLVLRSNNFHGPIVKAKTESPFPKLRILDLSHNEFSGVLITTYFKSFKSMMNLDNVEVRYMRDGGYYHDSVAVSMKGSEFELKRILNIFTTIDLSSNQFGGKIPEVGELNSLKVLNFSHNSLSGSIPSSMGKLAAIESLDLSSNKLVGEIPKQLTNLKFLAVLNLSQNQLSGPIPQGNQFNTFPNDSYSDNLGLCGVPLSKRCSKNEAPAFQEEGDGSASGFEWKGVMMGYGCGLMFGLSAGYIIFTKPEWLMRIVETAGNKLKRYHWLQNKLVILFDGWSLM